MDWERPRLMDRVMNRLGYRRPPPTTVVGVTSERLDDPLLGLGRIGGEHELSSVRLDIYRDMDEIDGLMPEGSRALDILADNAVNSPEGTQRSFSLRFDEGRKVSQSVQSVILDVVDRTRLQEKAYEIARSALKYGDNFQQIVVGKGMYIERLMYMEPASMRRNEDATGLLMTGKEKGRWAFEQYVPRTNQFIAGFYPWQIEHVRWARSGKSKYGRALLHTARYPFKKLQSMEEALVVNWLTRAFARILFKLDVTGKTPQEAQAYLEAFMQKLNRRSGTDMERMTVAKDIAIGLSYHDMGGKREPSRDDVQVLDTSNTGFWNITAVEYWRDKFITATGVPKAHLGLEQDINARATLQWQDERFARTIRRVQMMMSETIQHVIDLELRLHGINPQKIDYVIEWPTPSMLDTQTHSETVLRYAQAAEKLIASGVVDADYVAAHWLKMTPAQIGRVQTPGDQNGGMGRD